METIPGSGRVSILCLGPRIPQRSSRQEPPAERIDRRCFPKGVPTQESRDVHELFTERHRSGSIIVTSNRGPDEWLPTFADPVRAQAAIDRFTSNAYDLVIEGESYRSRLKPRVGHAPTNAPTPRPGQRRRARRQ